MLNCLVSKDGSVASVVALVGQGQYHLFLICSQQKHRCHNFQEKVSISQE